MGEVQRDMEKVNAFIQDCITSLEKGDYAYVKSGYDFRNDGGCYDRTIQLSAVRIVDKLVSLGYRYTTNHGYGCRDWTFYKNIE
jgi:hypothetical protein